MDHFTNTAQNTGEPKPKIVYTPAQQAALRQHAIEAADEALARHGIPDLEGKRHRNLVKSFRADDDEWAAILFR